MKKSPGLWFALLATFCVALPAGADTGPEWRYTVRPGDTLIGVSQRYLAQPEDWPKLQTLNHIANPRGLVPASSLRIPFAWLRQEPAPAKVAVVSGNVEAILPDKSTAPAAPGMLLPAGSQVRTAANASVSLLFADGSRMTLQPASFVQLDTVSVYTGGGMADTRVRLHQGRAEISANPQKMHGNRLEVITPSAIAAVRGTLFRVSAQESVMREETVEGQVAVAAAETEVKVAAAMGTLAEQGKPPIAPVTLPAAPDLSGLPVKLDRYPLRFPVPSQAGVESWAAQVSTDASFEKVLLEKQGRGPVLAFAELPDGQYFIRVRGVDANGLQGLDGIRGFEVDAHPFAPVLTQPSSKAVVRNAKPKLTWTQSTEAEQYRLQLARDAAFSQGMVEQVLPGLEYQPAADLLQGSYYWRVASISAGGEIGPSTDARQFDYKALPGAPEVDPKSMEFSEDEIRMALPKLPDGQHYELVLARDQKLLQPVWQGKPEGFSMRAPRPDAGNYYLGARAVESDGTAGAYAVQAIEVPAKPIWPYFLLLTPLLLAL